jgi:hypothetical protein
VSTRATFRVHAVKCVDETGGGLAERVGNDEIFLGGFGIDANGQTVKVGSTEVYAHFDDGDVKKFAPPRRFVTLDLNGRGSGSVTVGLLLVEKDGGGMGTALEKLYAKVVEELNREKQEESGRRGVASLTGAEVAALWAAIKPLIVAYVREKIVSAFNDDPFPLQSVSVTVGANGMFDGGRTTAPATVDFRGHDGIYRMTYDLELS